MFIANENLGNRKWGAYTGEVTFLRMHRNQTNFIAIVEQVARQDTGNALGSAAIERINEEKDPHVLDAPLSLSQNSRYLWATLEP